MTKTLRLFPALLSISLLTACATAEQTLLPNGQQGLSIDCSGATMTWQACFDKASDSCAGTGYQVIGMDGVPMLADNSRNVTTDLGDFKSRNVVVMCK